MVNKKPEDFKEILYESLLYSFGKTLAKYDVFSQNMMLEEVGKEILEYLEEFGFKIERENDENDIMKILELFIQNGFTKEMHVEPTPEGEKMVWHDMYGARAYDRLQEVTENPFLSCPLNACMVHEARKYGKYLKLIEQDFDLKNKITKTIELLEDGYPDKDDRFKSINIESSQLVEIAQEKKALLEIEHQELTQLANLDPLTGILNRRSFFKFVEKAAQQRDGDNVPMTLFMIDIDDFKKVNDTYGHAIGDEVIKYVVNVCNSNLRNGEIFARFGGEEFAIVLVNTDLHYAKDIADRLIKNVAAGEITPSKVHVTISVGIAQVHNMVHENFSDTIHDADKALYKAKHNGKNQYCIAK